MYETTKLVPTPKQCSFQLEIMSQSHKISNVTITKVLPGWSAISARHIYPVNRKDHYHSKVVEQEGLQTV